VFCSLRMGNSLVFLTTLFEINGFEQTENDRLDF
jgi:hypothetical protein